MTQNNYQLLPSSEIKKTCQACLSPYKVYKMKYNKLYVSCVINDSHSVVIYFNNGRTMTIPYTHIKSIETRKYFNTAIVLANSKIILTGWKSKSLFRHLKQCLINQMNTS